MKCRCLFPLGAILLTTLTSSSTSAQQFWDPDGATAGTSVSGNWDTTTANWTSVVDSGANTVWTQASDASFGIAVNYAVTLTEPITVGNITVTGSAGTLTIAGASVNGLSLAGSATLNTGGRNVTLSAPIAGGFDLTRSGAGTLTLSGASTYSGGTLNGAGTIALGVSTVSSGGSVVSGPLGTGPVTFSAASTISASGGARVFENAVNLNANLTVSGSAALTLTNSTWTLNAGNRTLTVNNTADTILASALADDGAARTLTKAGSGRLIMMVPQGSTFLGGITASAGTLVAGSSSPFPTNNNNAVTLNGSTLDLNGFDVRLARLGGNAAGSVLLGANTLTAGNDASSAEFAGVISGTGGYVKVGSISEVLSGTNTFSGGITIAAGALYLSTNGVSGSPYCLAAGANTITITGTGRVGANRAGGSLSIITNNLVLATVGAAAGLDPANGGTFILTGQASGSGGFYRYSQGSGVPVLAGDNTFTGGVQMDARLLGLAHTHALGTGTLTIGNPTNLPANNLELATFVDLVGAAAITNPVTVNQSFAFNGTLTNFGLELSGPVTLATGTKTITTTGTNVARISGAIGGSGGINKAGPNTLTLAANNNYTGSTVVSEGVLALTGSGSIASSSDLTVASLATLDVSGRADGTLAVSAPQTIGGSGTILAGASGGLNLSGGGTYRWTLSALSADPGSFDQLTLTNGSLVLGGSSELTINFGISAPGPESGDPFWSVPQSWPILLLAGATNPGNSDFVSVIHGVYTNGYFTTVATATNVLLNFTAGPPPQPVLGSVVGAGTANVTLNFTAAIKGANYQVEYKTNLDDLAWTVLGSVTGTGANAAITDTTAPPPASRFYRVLVQ